MSVDLLFVMQTFGNRKYGFPQIECFTEQLISRGTKQPCTTGQVIHESPFIDCVKGQFPHGR